MGLQPRNIVQGFVKNENLPVAFATVSDGSTSVQTDSKGYYQIGAMSTKLTVEKSGFYPNSIDLSQNKSGSNVNADVTLQMKDIKTAQSIMPGEMDMPAPKPKGNMKWLYIGIGLVVAIGGYMYYKKNKK